MKFTCALIVAIPGEVPALNRERQRIQRKDAKKIMLDIQNISKTFEKGTVT